MEDRIAQAFQGRTIFITGGSGFLGKTLIEKLLRCCDVGKIFLLMRTKKGKSPQERLDDIFQNAVFDLLKSEKPKAIPKCHIIPGDTTQLDLGISESDRELLQEEVEFIYHSAASTRFDDSVKRAVTFNTRSTKYLLDLAEKCKKLKAFVHISTAYAFPKEKVLYEKAYQPPDDPHKVIEVVNHGNDEEIEALLKDSPNTYTYSKALAEALVVEKMNQIPAIIVRPSVVCPIWREPLKGWCNTLQGPMGIFVGAGKGIIRTMYMKGDSYADFIPADIVINATLLATWNFLSDPKERIFNLTSSSEYNLTWEELINIGKGVIFNEVPFNWAVWYPGGSIKKSRWINNVCFFLFQLIPAILIDALLFVLGYKPILYQIQRRIEKGSEMFEYYTNRAWNFSNLKITELREKMNEKEKDIYKIDGEGLDVRQYLVECVWCVRRFILKETDESITTARRHMKIMWFVDIIFKVLFLLAVLHYGYNFYKLFLRFRA